MDQDRLCNKVTYDCTYSTTNNHLLLLTNLGGIKRDLVPLLHKKLVF
jgi:hypothetical protein